MPGGPEAILEAKLAALRERFVAERLPGLLDGIDAAARAAAAADWAQEPTYQARLAAHSLRGVAGTHGLAAVSQAAAAVEDILAAAGRAPPDPARAADLEAALAALGAAGRAARSTAMPGDAG